MGRVALQVLLLCLVIVLSVILPLGCSKSSDQAQQSTTSSQPAGGTTSTGSPAVSGTTSTGTGGAGPKGLPEIADLKSLSSYRLSIMSKIVEGTGAGPVSYMKFEWVKAQKAEHTWMEDASGKIQEVSMSIGDKEWMYIPGMGWIEQPPQATPGPSEASDLVEQIEQAEDSRFDKKGTETVNGVKCTKYEFEYNATLETPNMAGGGTIKTDMHSSGNVWIADQGGLPAVMIKSVSTAEINSSGQKSVIESEQNLTDIGANITISPPEGAVQIPTMPTIPTGLPTSPTTTVEVTPPEETETTSSPPEEEETTTPPAGEETGVFEDDFQGGLNPNWIWVDPNDDAQYSLTERAGFLRLTVPDNNDLSWATNYDAPRLLVPRSGDFIMETLVEFDPQVHYQGAGLVVWEGERNFLRLEFGYGGLGGEAKNVVFCKQENYDFGLANSADLPDIANQVELRLVREGDRFTAWYRQQGRPWVNMGFTDLPMDSTVEVGIIQISQYNTYTISADFGSFKVSTP